jgi:SAM-dependent MidA family methyltransferase
MNLALYHPELGYYASGAVNIGSEGDFFTSSHLSRDFGELLAEQFAQMWEILECPTPFTLVEMGAGQGLVAADILYYLNQKYSDCFEAVEYIIVETAAGLMTQQQQQLQRLKLGAKPLPLRWCSFEEISEKSITGCCFSNELVDAFPVHQVVLNGGELQEVYVTTTNSTDESIDFVEIIDTLSTPKLVEYFDFVGVNLRAGVYGEGYRTEINLAALDWIETVANKLKRGFLLTIDYGYQANRYYLPSRSQGTLQCYYHHRHHNDPYVNIGQQDITAHVNFTALERQGELCGLHTVGFTQQGLFLMALGLGERILALSNADSERGNAIASSQDIVTIMRRRQVLHQLMEPMGLGGFGVLVQSQGLTEEQNQRSLKGLTVPPMF